MRVHMKKYLFVVLLVGVCFGQSNSEPKRSEKITERHENGLKKLVFVYEGEGLNETLVAKYGFYENGKKAFIYNYNNNLLNGDYTRWHFNGQKSVKGYYKENFAENNFKTWYENGNLNEEINYQNGKKNGKYIQRNYEGEIISEGNYINDLEDGEWFSNHDNKVIVKFIKGNKEGKYQEFKNNILIVKGYYTNDEKVKRWIFYHDNGKIKSEGSFVKDKKNGDWFSFNSIGIKISSQVYEMGYIDGFPFKEFYSNGSLKLNGQFYDGYKIGKWEYFDEDGFKTDQKMFKRGKLNGKQEMYDHNRTLKKITEYVEGKKTGIYQVWENGNLSYDGKYKNSDRVGNWNSYEYFDGKKILVSQAQYFGGNTIPDSTHFSYNNDGTVLLGSTDIHVKYINSYYPNELSNTISYKTIRTFFRNGDLKSKKSYMTKIDDWDKQYPEKLYTKYILRGKYLVIDKEKEIDTALYYINDDKYLSLVQSMVPNQGKFYGIGYGVNTSGPNERYLWDIKYPYYKGKFDKEEGFYKRAFEDYIQKYYNNLTKGLFVEFKKQIIPPSELGNSKGIWDLFRYSGGYSKESILKDDLSWKFYQSFKHFITDGNTLVDNIGSYDFSKFNYEEKSEFLYKIKESDFYINDIQNFCMNLRDEAIDVFLDKKITYENNQEKLIDEIIENERIRKKSIRQCCIYPIIVYYLITIPWEDIGYE